jgi:transcriptional regulator with XRE-family HTH domain
MARAQSKSTAIAAILRPSPSAATPANRIGRQAKGLYPSVSRKLLAQAVGSDACTIVRVLNGSMNPTLALAGEMAVALGLDLKELVADLEGVRREQGVKGGRMQRQGQGQAGRKPKRQWGKQAVRAKLKSKSKRK